MTLRLPSPANEIVCREFVRLVTPYLEDALPPDERAVIERQFGGWRNANR